MHDGGDPAGLSVSGRSPTRAHQQVFPTLLYPYGTSRVTYCPRRTGIVGERQRLQRRERGKPGPYP